MTVGWPASVIGESKRKVDGGFGWFLCETLAHEPGADRRYLQTLRDFVGRA